MAKEKVVAVAFLTQEHLDHLGAGFRSYLSIEDDDIFSELMSALDKVEAAPLGRGVTLMPTTCHHRGHE